MNERVELLNGRPIDALHVVRMQERRKCGAARRGGGSRFGCQQTEKFTPTTGARIGVRAPGRLAAHCFNDRVHKFAIDGVDQLWSEDEAFGFIWSEWGQRRRCAGD
eukprot:2181658-Pleurochrysis_carterae.AAC.1